MGETLGTTQRIVGALEATTKFLEKGLDEVKEHFDEKTEQITEKVDNLASRVASIEGVCRDRGARFEEVLAEEAAREHGKGNGHEPLLKKILRKWFIG